MWRYVGSDKQQHSATAEELEAMLFKGHVKRSTLVWAKGEAGWAKLEAVPALATLCQSRPAVVPHELDLSAIRGVGSGGTPRAADPIPSGRGRTDSAGSDLGSDDEDGGKKSKSRWRPKLLSVLGGASKGHDVHVRARQPSDGVATHQLTSSRI